MPGERELLVRRNYEAYRDLVWFDQLEPKFREQRIEGEVLQAFRDEWNKHAETRDWAWWKKETADKPSDRLEDEIMDITYRLDQIGSIRWRETLAEASLRPGNDSHKEKER
jgi:hypothetical protein